MAKVTCPDCSLEYDDTYRLTICPDHKPFHMQTLVVNAAGEERICSTVEEAREHMKAKKIKTVWDGMTLKQRTDWLEGVLQEERRKTEKLEKRVEILEGHLRDLLKGHARAGRS